MKDQGHDGKCDSSATFSCCSTDEGSNDHGDGHWVVGWEVGEEIFLNKNSIDLVLLQ